MSKCERTRGRFRRATVGACVLAMGMPLGALGAAGLAGAQEAGENWPDRPLEYVIPYNPGGSTDPIGRKFAELLSEELGVDVIVHNRAGGDETIGVSSVIVDNASSPYILGLTSATGFITQPIINPDLAYDGPDDWTNIVKLIEAPNSLLVRADAPWENLDDFLAEARERPGELTVGTTGRLSRTTMTMIRLESEAEVDVTVSPFSGGAGEAVAAVLGGHADAAVVTIPGQLGLIDSGELRAIAHTGADPYERTPGSVPLEEAGYNVPFATDYFTIAPPGMPDAARDRLVEAATNVVESEAYRDWAGENGYLVNTGGPDMIADWYAENREMTREILARIEEENPESTP